MSALYVDSIKDKSDTKTLATLSNTATTLHSDVVFPAGMILNVVSTNGSTEYTTSATTWGASTKISDIETVHTCASSSNKVLLNATFVSKAKTTFYYADFYKIVSGTTTYNISGESEGICRLYGEVHNTVHIQHLFAPSSITAHTYGVSFRSYSNVSANAGGNDLASNLTVMEIQA